RSYRTCVGSTPKYVEDPDTEFGELPLYTTPAEATSVQRTMITFNAIDDLTLTTGDSKGMNTPNLGKRVYLNLLWEARDAERPQQGYGFYAFTFGDYCLPSVCRVGKKGTPARVRWAELPNPLAMFRDEPQRPTHPVNPLDASGILRNYDIIAIPPHWLM